MDDETRSAHVIALENARLLVLRRDDFHRCLDTTPHIALGLLRALSKRLRQADNQIGGLVLLDVAGRIARLLLQLADEGNGSVITAKLTHHTIAQMIGSSRETVSRTIRAVIEQDRIGVSQKTITIKNRKALEFAAGLR